MWRVGLVLSCVLAAAAATLATPDRIVDRWSVQEGLPNHALSSILQSRDGYLWIATWAGIVQFDGVRFTPIAENLPNSHARVLFEDTRGAIWIGVAGSGLSRWMDGRVETYTPAAGLAGQDVRAIAEDRGGRIWAGTENGITILDQGRMRTLRAEQGLPRNIVTGLAAAPDGRVWIATTGGLCVTSSPESRCERVGIATESPDVVFADRAGRVWIGSSQGLRVLNGGAPPLPSCPVHCLDATPITAVMETREGDLWAGLGDAGAARLHRSGIDRVSTADGLPAGNVVTLAEDAEGSVWVGVYNGGLARITRRRVATYSTADGLPGDVIGSIVQDRDGAIWAGTQCGPIARLHNGRFEPQLVDEMRGASLNAGATGYVLKRARPEEIVRAVRDVSEGGAPMSGAIAREVVQFFRENQPSPEVSTLTDRERAVLTSLSEGQQYKEIADNLAISINTVRQYIKNIYDKLHVNTRAEAVRKLGRV